MRSSVKPCPIRGVAAGVVAGALGVGLAMSGPCGARAAVSRAVGAWDLKLQGGDRECRITLRPELASNGHAVAMPVGCRRAFPVLADVAMWTEADEGRLRLDDAAGQAVLKFEPGPDGVLSSTSPQGEIFRLESAGVHREVKLADPKPSEASRRSAPPVAPGQGEGAPTPRLPVPAVADMAGYFAVLREKTRDTGCMVTFDGKVRGPGATLKAHLAPACRDQGIVIFDPVGWQLSGGRLVLTARKGHTAKFDLQADGSWLKDPAEGKSLSLKKM